MCTGNLHVKKAKEIMESHSLGNFLMEEQITPSCEMVLVDRVKPHKEFEIP